MIQASVTFVYELARIKDVQAAVKDVESSVGIIIITCSDSSKGGHYDLKIVACSLKHHQVQF